MSASHHRTPLVRLALALVGAGAVWLGVGAAVPDGYTHARHAARAIGVLVPVLVLWYAISRATGTPRRPTRGDLTRALVAALAYLAPTALAVAAVVALDAAQLTPRLPAGAAIAQALLLLVLVLAYEAIPEELVFRDLVQTSLGHLGGPRLAVIGQALLFAAWGAVIGAGRTPDRVALFVVFGLVQGLVRHLGGGVASSIGFHAAFQLSAQWLIGGTWDAWAVHDPELWLAGALFLPGAVLAPVIVWLVQRSTTTRPDDPSTVTVSPEAIRSDASGTPTTAGMPYSRATTAPCEFEPPISITSPPAVRNSGVQPGSVDGQTRISPGSK